MDTKTPRRNFRSGSVDSTLIRRGGSLKKTQFPFTEKWNNIVNNFIKNCPRGRHRRQFTYVENSFTGKEAVDFMMEEIPKTLMDGRPVARENCSKLLQKFLEEKHFYQYGSQAGKSQVFKDNTLLYCFFKETINKPTTPKLIRRGSLNSPIQKRMSPESPKFNGRIPLSPPREEGFNRRRSMSCNNLLQLESQPHEQPRRRMERRSRDPVRVVDVAPSCDRIKTVDPGNDGFYDYFKKSFEKFGRRIRSPSPMPSSEPELISKSAITTPCSLPSPNIASPPALNEIDMWSVYKTCLLRRLQETVGGTDSFLCWHIKGNDIKWNCEKVDNMGLVIPKTKSDIYSDYIMRLINYLMMFPFINENVNAVKYDEYQETKVFNVLCSNLERLPSLLTHDEANALLHAVGYFKEISLKKILHEPISNFSPRVTRSRSQQRLINENAPSQCSNQCSRSSTPMSIVSQLPTAIKTNGLNDQIAFPTRRRSNSTTSPASFLTPGYRSTSLNESPNHITIEDVHSLPGLIISSEVEAKINEYFSSPESLTSPSIRAKSGLSYLTARTSFTPFQQKLNEEETASLLVTINLLFLTIPTSRRWKLQTILRLMNKISNDENLRLDPFQSNSEILIERLGKIIFPARSLNSLQIIELARILTIGDTTVGIEVFFKPDNELLKAVKEMETDIQRQRMTNTESVELNNAPTPPNNVVQFCQLTTSTTYEAQNSQTTDFLLPLLDSIINNENMKPTEKEKKLKQFRAAHPNVYAKRLPLHDVQEEAKRTVFQRIFRM